MSQNERILQMLKSGRKVSPMEALNEAGCFRLAARINDLRRAGHSIHSATVKENGTRYSRYYMGETA